MVEERAAAFQEWEQLQAEHQRLQTMVQKR